MGIFRAVWNGIKHIGKNTYNGVKTIGKTIYNHRKDIAKVGSAVGKGLKYAGDVAKYIPAVSNFAPLMNKVGDYIDKFSKRIT